MNHLKHIIIIVITLIVIGLTAKAQNTDRQPYEGALHTYTCDGISVGAVYTFYMAAHSDGSGVYDDGLTGEFDIIKANGTVGDDGLASTPIQWNLGASAHVYYLFLEASIPGGCSNQISIQITPQVNQFDMLSENVPVSNTKSCPAVTSDDGFNPLASAYDAGFTKLEFNIVRKNGTDNKLTASTGGTYNWSFIPVLSVDPDLNLGKVIISIQGTNSGMVTADANNRYTINGLDNEVLVTVSIENAPGNTRDVKLQVTGQREEITNLSDSNPANDAVIHTIEVMPVINGMGGV
jgi:hypothetical protein